MHSQVIVRTGARLHFGLLAVNPQHGRKFGGVGIMLTDPGYELVLTPADSPRVTGGSEVTASRVRSYQSQIYAAFGKLAPLEISLIAEIPSHEGLGSGTQLALAVAAGMHEFSGLPKQPATELAKLVGRGARSAIGVHGFDHGGFLIEAGKRDEAEISPLVCRTDIPADWRWLLVAPPATAGLSGIAEQQAFRQLPPMPEVLSSTLCRILLTEWLPAMLARDVGNVSAAMWEYGQVIGGYFACVQGGAFADRRMELLAHELRLQDSLGIAQTSWGPTIVILCSDADQADSLRRRIVADHRWHDLRIRVASGKNTGADLTTVSSAGGSNPNSAAEHDAGIAARG